MIKKGFFDEPSSKKKESSKGQKSNQRKTGESNSQINHTDLDTTIYKDALEKLSEEENMVTNDPEITFNFKNRESSSSEDQIDTSDDLLMEVDVHNQFIADCQAEARRLSGSSKTTARTSAGRS